MISPRYNGPMLNEELVLERSADTEESFSELCACTLLILIQRRRLEARQSFLDGLSAERERHHYRALIKWNNALKLDPLFKEAYRARGLLRVQMSSTVLARKDFSTILKLDDSDSAAFLERGRIYTREGRFDEAISDFQNGLKALSKRDDPDHDIDSPSDPTLDLQIRRLFQELPSHSRFSPEYQEFESKIQEYRELHSTLQRLESENLALKTKIGEFKKERLSDFYPIVIRFLDSLPVRVNAKKAPRQSRSEVKTPDPHLKKLYKEAARLLHPDLAPENQKLSREKLMASANLAFQEGKAEELEDIVADWLSQPFLVKGFSFGDCLVRLIRSNSALRHRIKRAKKESSNLKSSAVHELKEAVSDASRIGLDLLAQVRLSIALREVQI